MLLIGTGVVYTQLQYMQNERLGFSGEQVVMVPIESRQARERFDTFRETLAQHPNIVTVSASDFIPGRINSTNGFRPEGAPGSEAYVMAAGRVSHEYLETLDIELVHGRTFDRAFPTDVDDATVINEAGARELGWTPEEAVGKRITEISAGPNDEDLHRTVIGVVRDFHFESLHNAIRPLALNIEPDNFQRALIRIQSGNLPATLDFIQREWETFESGFPYSALFLNEDFSRFYQQERRLTRIFVVFTILAVLIACMGLFGLASFIAQKRTKEIGLRKVMGASVPNLVLLLSSEFTRLVLIAAAVALPVAYFVMRQWLENFAYQADLSWWLFVAASGLALVIAWITVSFQSIKAALMNPIDTLRCE